MCDDFGELLRMATDQANINLSTSGNSQIDINLPDPDAFQEGKDLIENLKHYKRYQ